MWKKRIASKARRRGPGSHMLKGQQPPIFKREKSREHIPYTWKGVAGTRGRGSLRVTALAYRGFTVGVHGDPKGSRYKRMTQRMRHEWHKEEEKGTM